MILFFAGLAASNATDAFGNCSVGLCFVSL